MSLTSGRIETFRIHLHGPHRGPLPISFEQAETNLVALPRLFFEPDGSFVWRPAQSQQIDGMVYDVVGQIQYVELCGQSDHASWDKVISAFGDGPKSVVKLPSGELQDLQTFEGTIWPAAR